MKTLLELVAAVVAAGGLYVFNASPPDPAVRTPRQARSPTSDCRAGTNALVNAGVAPSPANDRCSEKERLVRQQHGTR